MKLKRLSIISFIAILSILLINNQSKAVIQSSGGTGISYSLNDWMINIRNMETLGSGMGLNEEINENLTSTTSNNIDIHMQKNTEYGALAILSASSYGNPNVIASGDTTTGNKSGVVMQINKEWVVAGYSNTQANNFLNSALRYKNVYESPAVAKIGDATEETSGWHSSKAATWMNGASRGLVRGYSGSIFSFFGGLTRWRSKS